MQVGFTGTRQGMTERQHAALEALLAHFLLGGGCADPHPALLHGGCVGADAEADEIARRAGMRRRIWPGMVGSRFRSFCELVQPGTADVAPPEEPLARNRRIVQCCDLLVAAPQTAQERLRSGTWMTVRHARLVGRPVVVLDP